MIEKIIEFSARNKFLVLIVTAAILVLSWQAMKKMPLDAVPDLSDTQVIIYSQWDRSPDLIEDQVTYPIVTAMLGAPKIKAVRGFSDFGYSYVYVIFEDGTDLYWARSRVLEYLSKIQAGLPKDVKTELGPDATSVGWVYQYALVDDSNRLTLPELRSLQDWYLKFMLQAVPGVSEIAAVGGFVKQLQVNADPDKLLAYGLTMKDVVDAVKRASNDGGGRLLEVNGFEFMVRSRGYAKTPEDIGSAAIRTNAEVGASLLVRDVAQVEWGPDMTRGVAELNGQGDVVGGIVVMRHGENALRVIERVKSKIKEIQPSLPEGVRVVETYDRSDLIRRAISTLKHTLTEEMIIVSVVILIFLWHIPSAIVPILTIPISVLIAFIPMAAAGLTTNIMSLAGIAISIGVLVDGAIIEVENAYKKLERWQAEGRKGDFHEIRLAALKEVGPSVFFSLLVIAVAFIPVFALVDQEGRLFRPLAMSKNFAMAIAAVLAITLDPAMRMLFARMDPFTFRPRFLASAASAVFVGKYYPEEKHPVSRVLFHFYEPMVNWVLRHRKITIVSALALFLVTVPFYFKLGKEFMPPLNEGSLLYMPTALPGMAADEARRILKIQDKILASFPEVKSVFGKAGRAESSTDPAPLSMIETTIVLKPQEVWRETAREFPEWFPAKLKSWLGARLPKRKITIEELTSEMDRALQLPGIPNIWTMPIKNRIDMLATGIRTPVGIKVLGADLKVIQQIGEQLESVLKPLAGTRSVFAERAAGGYFLDFELKRDALARYGLSVEEAEEVIASAIGGEEILTLLDGRARYSVNARLARDFRSDLAALGRVRVGTSSGAQIPISEIAEIETQEGPAMIRNENGLLAGYVFVDVAGRDVGGYVQEAKRVVSDLQIPAGYQLVWSGQYENMQRVKERLKFVIPLTLFIIALLLYINTKSAVKTGIVLLSVPLSLIGAVWILYALDYNMSIAVWVGMIALMGLDAEMGVFMLLYLDLAYDEAKRDGRMRNKNDLRLAIIHGAVRRVRPKMMTVIAAMAGLLPILWAQGAGADVMRRIAAPMIGGLGSSFLLELLIYPVLYAIWKEKEFKKNGRTV
ncbi:MAG TPA: efflux RND transporter permease subunit [Candidatus Omnitrophota bacterium]|nr:efflux RND transporter permease subunit [Candidatus Omnitrophota bacterium]